MRKEAKEKDGEKSCGKHEESKNDMAKELPQGTKEYRALARPATGPEGKYTNWNDISTTISTNTGTAVPYPKGEPHPTVPKAAGASEKGPEVHEHTAQRLPVPTAWTSGKYKIQSKKMQEPTLLENIFDPLNVPEERVVDHDQVSTYLHSLSAYRMLTCTTRRKPPDLPTPKARASSHP